MPYPELFWSQYTGLGSQTQTPKCSKVLISGVSFCQHSLSRSQESDVLSYSKGKIAKDFQGFAPGPHWGGLTAPPQTPRLHNGFSPRYACWKTGTPQKLLDTAMTAIPTPWLLILDSLTIQRAISNILWHFKLLLKCVPNELPLFQSEVLSLMFVICIEPKVNQMVCMIGTISTI